VEFCLLVYMVVVLWGFKEGEAGGGGGDVVVVRSPRTAEWVEK